MPFGPLLLFDTPAAPPGGAVAPGLYAARRRRGDVLTIYRSEASASLRRVPLWLVGSNGTSPATGEAAGQPWLYWQARNSGANTTATLSAVSANAGEYFVELTASEVSQLGLIQVQYRSDTALQNATYAQVVNLDSGNSRDYGLTAFSEVSIHAGTHSGVTIQGLSNYANISSVTLNAGTHSGATIQGLSNYANISNVTLAAGTHSNVTIQGISNYANISNVTLAAGVHSGATVGVGSIKPAAYSGVSVEVTTAGIASSSFKVSAIDAAALATDAGQEIADRVLLRGIATGSDTGRSVQDALRGIRNRVTLPATAGGIGTVYQEDDTTSAWTFSTTTGAATAITEIDPG